MSAITFSNVSKFYRGGWFSRSGTDALQDVSFDVPTGSVTAVLGANGAGKTTAIRCLLGLERPDAGTVSVLEMDPKIDGLEVRRRIGYVAEQPALYDWMTIAETGWFASGFYPLGYEAEYGRWCERFHLPPEQKVKALSKGMRAKVALALALAHTPELLILDEPTSGLDPLVRREFLESMVGVAAEGRTVLLCSHQVSEVERVADRALVLIDGHLVAAEDLGELKESCTELVVSKTEVSADIPAPPGTLLARIPIGSEELFLTRDADPAAVREWENTVGPARSRTPGLEDILLALLREARRPAAAARQPETTPAAG